MAAPSEDAGPCACDGDVCVLEIAPAQCARLCARLEGMASLSLLGVSVEVVHPTKEARASASPYHAPADHNAVWVRTTSDTHGAGGDGAGALETFMRSFVRDWVATRFVNSVHPIYRQHWRALDASSGGEAAVTKAVAAMVEGCAGCTAVRLQAKHYAGDAKFVRRIGAALHAAGVPLHPKQYTHVVSLVCDDRDPATGNAIYASICTRAMIEPFFQAKREQQSQQAKLASGGAIVCRAAWKLLERLQEEVHGLPDAFAAIDIGSAPGGWTEHLANEAKCAKVVSVDPAELNDGVLALPKVVHVKQKVVEAVPSLKVNHPSGFHLVTCDMNFDSREAAKAVAEVAQGGLCAEGSRLIMTVKLPQRCGEGQATKQIDECTAVLRGVGYTDFRTIHQMTNTPWERTLTAKHTTGPRPQKEF